MNNVLEITGATLLSVEEAKQLNGDMLKASEDWWLRSPGHDGGCAACVYGAHGSVLNFGDYVKRSFGVRPALTISNLESTNLGIGDSITFGNHSFTIISSKYALCNEIVGKCAFKKYWYELYEPSNDYQNSDVKKYVDRWFEENRERKESICFDCSIYTDAISMFEYATGNNAGHYNVVDAVVSQIGQGDPVIEDVEEELNERFGDGAADHLDDIDLKDYITYTGVCEIDYEEMAAGDSDLLVYRVSCEFDVDKYAKEYDLKEIDEQDEGKEI